jgi:hypothetical protein
MCACVYLFQDRHDSLERVTSSTTGVCRPGEGAEGTTAANSKMLHSSGRGRRSGKAEAGMASAGQAEGRLQWAQTQQDRAKAAHRLLDLSTSPGVTLSSR